jgi:hypothetical protein
MGKYAHQQLLDDSFPCGKILSSLTSKNRPETQVTGNYATPSLATFQELA